MARPKKETKESTTETVYLHNATERVVEINGKVVEPDDAVSVPVELVEEAKAKGLV